MDLHRLAALFDHEPVAVTFFFLLIAMSAIGSLIAASIGVFSACEWLKNKRLGVLRDPAPALAKRAEPT
jgi:hypothetical protein